jgi:hypothetical protein
MQETDYNMRYRALLRDEVVARLKQLGNVTTLFLTLSCLLFFEQCLSQWCLFFYHCMSGKDSHINSWEHGILNIVSRKRKTLETAVKVAFSQNMWGSWNITFCVGEWCKWLSAADIPESSSSQGRSPDWGMDARCRPSHVSSAHSVHSSVPWGRIQDANFTAEKCRYFPSTSCRYYNVHLLQKAMMATGCAPSTLFWRHSCNPLWTLLYFNPLIA